jgi:uncharacterized protein (DUF1501 family)
MLSRRFFLKGSALVACSAAAHPLMTSVTLAATPGENRLVVIILRGAMDGLDVVQPWGDPLLAEYRPGFKTGPAGGAADLDGFFALHAGLMPLLPLWQKGELAFAHAVSTPYRDKRSHFDGQDILEAGTGPDVAIGASRDGWLNRLVQVIPGATVHTAFSVGVEEMLLMSGKAPVSSWAPDADLALTPQARLLLEHVYHDDALFRDAGARAMELGALAESRDAGPMDGASGNTRATRALARFAAARMNEDTRIAAFSLTGWDTHRGQTGMLTKALDRLAAAVLELREGLGGNWGRTTVLAMTEFGRTARENGTVGTDHGTGGAMLLAGGAIRGGKVWGKWPGLDGLYDGRDLMPTGDVRDYAAFAMQGLFGVSADAISNRVFPGLDAGRDPGVLL